MTQVPQQQDDAITLALLLVGAGGFGLFSIGTFLRPARVWMLEHGILVSGEKVFMPLVDDVGLDIWRLVAVAGAVLVIAVVAWSFFRRRISDV